MLPGQGGPVQTPTLNVTVPYLMVTFGNFQSELYQKCPGPPLSSLLQKMMLGPQFSFNSANSARHEDFVQMVEHVCTLVWVQGAHTPSSLFPKQFLSFWLFFVSLASSLPLVSLFPYQDFILPHHTYDIHRAWGSEMTHAA